MIYTVFMEILKCKDSPYLLDFKTEKTVKKYLPDKASLSPLANLFAAVSDAARLQILSALSITDMCVTDLSAILGVNQTTLSHQLKSLRDAKLVNCIKQGKTVFYAISNKAVNDLMMTATALSS